jgi:hypothetical protein
VLVRSILFCLALALPGRAFAASLRWDVPEGCPDAQTLERETEQALGEPLARHALTATGVIVPEDGQLHLMLRIQLPDSESPRVRELSAAHCGELLEAAAVAIALAAAESGKRAPAPLDLGPPERPPLAAGPPPPPPVDTGVVIALDAVSALGALPAPGLGGELQLGWRRGGLRVGLAFTWLPPRSMALGRGGLEARFGLAALDALVCAQGRVSELRLGGCGALELGLLSARLDGGMASTQQSAWRAVGIRGLASYPISGPLEVAATLSLMAPLTRPQFFVQEGESRLVHQTARLEGRLQLGVLFWW